jgi:hypothetical protein
MRNTKIGEQELFRRSRDEYNNEQGNDKDDNFVQMDEKYQRRCCCGLIMFYPVILAISILGLIEGFWLAFVLMADHTII